MKLDLYDFDGTIYDGDSGVDLILFAIKKKPSLIFYYICSLGVVIKYLLKIIKKEEMKNRLFGFLKYFPDTDKFVKEFNLGYKTELEQGGANVSGGQKQRLCIARALLKKPKIIILDDSTSAVDTATEAQIRRAFKEDLADSTKIIIAQRISSVKDADIIVVMDDGQITGVGNHDELMKTNQEYKEIYASQTDMKEENK